MIHHPDDEKNGGPGSTALKASGLQALSPADPSVIAALVSYLINPEAYFVTGEVHLTFCFCYPDCHYKAKRSMLMEVSFLTSTLVQ
ncbi:hypothetical protein A0H81_02558 [Grifola frondosa]|uniref:Uncharacterized protein n=1 Tax=Grifola frondosa TaxID=5627 RepID=A0A1C7MMA7_GRIFR|nr:hypothetical protein A0H81_02558 [Grifola frondosa]